MCHVAPQSGTLGQVLQAGVGAGDGHGLVLPALDGVNDPGSDHPLRREEPGPAEALDLPVVPQQLQVLVTELDPALLAALAFGHMDGVAAGVDVLDTKVAQLGQPQARGQRSRQECMDVRLGLGCIEQGPSLVVGEWPPGRCPWNPRPGHILHHLWAVQREQVQEAKRRVVDHQGRGFATQFVQQQQEPTDLVLAEMLGGYPVVAGVDGDTVDVLLSGSHRELAKTHVFFHPSTERCHVLSFETRFVKRLGSRGQGS